MFTSGVYKSLITLTGSRKPLVIGCSLTGILFVLSAIDSHTV